jgi:hypothetical protein
MTLYLFKGYLDVAATTLADAKELLAALANPGTAANAAIIGRITEKLETLVQSDSGEPLVISSIDDTTGTISSWVTDADTSLAVGLGDIDPTTTSSYASTSTFSIVGSTRTGLLALNTAALAARLSPCSGFSSQRFSVSALVLQVRKTTAGVTETVGLISLNVSPGVLSSTTNEADESQASAAALSATAADEAKTAAEAAAASITSLLGEPDGVATLDSDGKLPAAQLPALAVTSVAGLTGAISDVGLKTALALGSTDAPTFAGVTLGTSGLTLAGAETFNSTTPSAFPHNTYATTDALDIKANGVQRDINLYPTANGQVNILAGKGIGFMPKSSGPDFGTGIGGFQYREAVESMTRPFFIWRGGGYVFEDEGANRIAQFFPSRINFGNQNTAKTPLNTFEITNTGGPVISALAGTNLIVSNDSATCRVALGQSNANYGRLAWVYNATAASAYMALGPTNTTNALVLHDSGGEVKVGTSGTTGARFAVNGAIALVDGMTAPTATSGFVKFYVDSADGDLKVIFGDGTIKTITTDT